MSGSNSSAPGAEAAPDGAAPLSFTVHSLPVAQPLPEASRRTRLGRVKMLFVLAVCASPVIASYFTYFVIRPEGRSNYGQLIEPSRPMPQMSLKDLSGNAVPTSSLKGQWLLVVVSGGQCDATCEKLLWLQRQLRETLGREKDRVDKVWLIHDGVAPRPETRDAVSGGVPATILQVDRDALASWLQPPPGGALEQHIAIVDPHGHWMMRVPADPDPAKLKRDVERLLRASASWDRAGR